MFLSTCCSLASMHFLLDRYLKVAFEGNLLLYLGNSDLHNGVEFGWLYTLSVTSRLEMKAGFSETKKIEVPLLIT